MKKILIILLTTVGITATAQPPKKVINVVGGSSSGGTLQQSFDLSPTANPQIYGSGNTVFGIKGFHQYSFKTDTTLSTYGEWLIDPQTTGEGRLLIKKTDGTEGGLSFSPTNTSLWSFGSRFSVSFGATSNDSKFLFKSHNTITHTGSEISGDSSKIIISPKDSLLFKNIEGTGSYIALTDSGKMYRTSGTGGTTANSITFNNSNSGASSGQSFDGSAAVTISANTVGAKAIGDSAGLGRNSGFATGFALNKKIDSLLSLMQLSTTIKKAVDDTSTITARKDISELTFPVQASKKYRLTGVLLTGCDNTGGIRFDINGPASTTVTGGIIGTGTALTNTGSTSITALTTFGSGTAFNKVPNNGGTAYLNILISTSSTAGNITVGFSSVTAGQKTTVFAGSFLELKEVQ